MSLPGVLAAELAKIRTLPTAVLTMVGTVLVGGVLGAALAASGLDGGGSPGSVEVALVAVPFVQAGMVLLGVLPVAHEYAGGQIRTTLVAMPDRGLLVVGKALAALLVTAVTAVATMGVTLLAAVIVLGDAAAAGAGLGPVAGAAGYLTVVAMLAFAVALLVRHLVPALVSTLALVVSLSPLLAAQTAHARWLPDRAAQQLYSATDSVLTPVTGALVALGWVAAIGFSAGARFIRRDA